jgi:hypothetical protein
VLARAVVDVVAHRGLALAGLGQHVHDAHRVQLLGRVEAAGHDHLLRLHLADPAGQEAVGAHAGEEVEEDLGQAELHLPLGHDDVEGQRAFEAAAQRVTLHQRDGDDRRLEGLGIAVDRLDAEMAVAAQRRQVAVADLLREEGEVAAEVEDARQPAAHDVVAQRGAELGAAVGRERVAQQGLLGEDVLQQVQREAGLRARAHMGPEAGRVGLQPRLQRGEAGGGQHRGGIAEGASAEGAGGGLGFRGEKEGHRMLRLGDDRPVRGRNRSRSGGRDAMLTRNASRLSCKPRLPLACAATPSDIAAT